MQRSIFCVLAALLLLTITSNSFSASQTDLEDFDLDIMDQFIEGQMRRHNIPGVAVAITKGDDLVYSKGFGSASRNVPMSADTPMFIGSLSKSFTALAIMQLHEEGMLDIDKPVIMYLPCFKLADPQATQEITIRNLLHHTSGLSDFSYLSQHTDDVGIQESIGYLSGASLTAPVGSTFQYFNSNYTILGAVVEKVSGLPYGEYIETHVFQPLGMKNSFTNLAAAAQAGLPSGYGNFFGFSVPRRQPFRVYDQPAGYLMMSANDLSQYLRSQLHDGLFNGKRILSADGVKAMHTPQPGLDAPYGMGWFVYEKLGLQIIEHGGTNENFHTAGILLPEKDMTIAILTNKNSLFHALFGNQQLNDGVVSIAAGLAIPQSGIPIRMIGNMMLAIFLLNMLLTFRSILRINQWRKVFDKKGRFSKIWDVGSHFIIPSLLILLVPVLVSSFLQRGFSWQAGWWQAPDGIFWLFAGILLDLIQGSIKSLILIKNRR